MSKPRRRRRECRAGRIRARTGPDPAIVPAIADLASALPKVTPDPRPPVEAMLSAMRGGDDDSRPG